MIMLEVAALSVQADPQALYDAAVADRLGGRPAAAVPKLQQVLAARADDVDARLNLGLALLALNRTDEAAEAFRDVIAQAPDYTDAYIGLARVEQRRGNLATARLNVAAALRRAPGNPEALALTIDASAARYRTGVVTGLHPGLRVGSADGHFQVSARW
ncbi:MAG: tetratricopeptide repeat protein, partial [Caulobacteraceae bacterium]